MPGRIVRVIPRRYYNFNALAPNEDGGVFLAERIDVVDYDKVDLLVRIHALEIGDENGNGSGRFEVQVLSDGYTCEDPDRTSPPFMAPIGAIIIDVGSEEGEFKTAQFTGPLGSMLMVSLAYKQDEQASLDLTGEFSIDLVLKH